MMKLFKFFPGDIIQSVNNPSIVCVVYSVGVTNNGDLHSSEYYKVYSFDNNSSLSWRFISSEEQNYYNKINFIGSESIKSFPIIPDWICKDGTCGPKNLLGWDACEDCPLGCIKKDSSLNDQIFFPGDTVKIYCEDGSFSHLDIIGAIVPLVDGSSYGGLREFNIDYDTDLDWRRESNTENLKLISQEILKCNLYYKTQKTKLRTTFYKIHSPQVKLTRRNSMYSSLESIRLVKEVCSMCISSDCDECSISKFIVSI